LNLNRPVTVDHLREGFVSVEQRTFQCFVERDGRSNQHAVVDLFDRFERVDLLDVDHPLRLHGVALQQADQVGPAGQYHCLTVVIV